MNVIMFSGQGAQKAGMGKDFYNNFVIAKQTFEEASDALSFDVAALCFEDANNQLALTQFAQPALVTTGIAAYRVLQQEGITAGLLMGLSLGEYTALVAAGVLDFARCVKLVHKRGLLMTELAVQGGMTAVMGLGRDVVEQICEKASYVGHVACANFNTPQQIVISGEKAALDACIPLIKEAKGKAIPLKVSGPFHTKLMQKAADAFVLEMADITPKAATLPIISNVTADVLATDNLAEHLSKHMTGSVLWDYSVVKAKEMGGTKFIELGCGNTLVNFVKKIDDTLETYTIESAAEVK
ncbi:MAG: ACP S-malonyltransferase [Defluviitaleaceae bacterium]|nr:ACP S-malonyltransferase [Defluviitaleaceae bacterium]